MGTRDQIIKLEQRLARSVAGQDDIAARLVLALLADGSVLLEGAEPEALRTVHRLSLHLDAEFRHVRFPASGARNGQKHEVHRQLDDPNQLFSPHAMFANIILVEGIDNAPDPIQTSLLAAISQREIVSGDMSHPLPALFFVLATQNASTHSTLPLRSEVQRDHFLIHLRTTHLMSSAANRVIERDFYHDVHHVAAPPPLQEPTEHGHGSSPPWARHDFIPQRAIFEARHQVRQVIVPSPIDACIGALTAALHNPARYAPDMERWISASFGLRGALALERASQAYAWRDGRTEVIFDDVRAVAGDCLRHRLVMTQRATAENRNADEIVMILLERLCTEVVHA